MNRRSCVTLVAGMLGIFLAAGWTWGKKDGEAEKPQPAPAAAAAPADAAAAPAAAQEEKIVHTFGTDEEIKAFTTLWQQRQGIITRMAVLRAYWSEEQSRLNEMDGQLSESYKLDLKKRHVLSQERKALIELEPLPEPADAQGSQPAPSSGG